VFSELRRYYKSARIFRFFMYHRYVYRSIVRDVIAKRVIKPEFSVPRNIVLKLSSRCNARCRFCYIQNETELERPELKLDEWKGIIDQAKQMGSYTVTLSGGEPTLYPYLIELVRYVRKKRMIPFTTTNGLVVTSDLLKELDAAGLCALNFSILAPGEKHDAIVGVEGAFDNIVRQGEFCARSTRIVTILSHVFTRESAREGWYAELWEMLRPKGFRAMNLLPICVSGPDKSDLLDGEELTVFDRVAKEPYVLMDTKNYARLMCPAAREDLLVNNFGEVQPCPFIPISFGNVRDAALKTLFLRMQDHPMFEQERSVCVAARDDQFIDSYIIPAYENPHLPAPIDEIWRG